MSEDTLQRYGTSFQSKVISALITDTKLMDSLSDIIFPKFFDSDASRWIVETILDYHKEYRRAPSLDVFKVELNKVDDVGLKKKVVEQLKVSYTQNDTSDLEYIKGEFSDFCRNQNLKEVIIQSVDLLKAGQYDRIKDLVDKAMKVGVDADLGSDYVQTFIDRITDEKRDTVETGWDVLDEVMGGGLGPGELGVVVAPSGVGKCVGKDTEIEIQYEQIGIEISGGHVMWFNPWDKIVIDSDVYYYAWQVEKLITISGYGKTS
jgi:replicative DNA helicase